MDVIVTHMYQNAQIVLANMCRITKFHTCACTQILIHIRMLLGGTCSQTLSFLQWANALPNYIVACLLLWASTHAMIMSISILIGHRVFKIQISFLIGHLVFKIQISFGGPMPVMVL